MHNGNDAVNEFKGMPSDIPEERLASREQLLVEFIRHLETPQASQVFTSTMWVLAHSIASIYMIIFYLSKKRSLHIIDIYVGQL